MTDTAADLPVRTRTVTWEDPAPGAEALGRMTGIAALEALRDGRVPLPPVLRLLGIDLIEAEAGRVVLGLVPSECHYNSNLSVMGGVVAALLDAAMTHAVHSNL
ncbi:MAG: aromatic compound degradation protein PaaI, partial [Proteobacteria bacterium]|nr:aromatic compound degradation protein PaaI [Pseudomonadota bacterium]